MKLKHILLILISIAFCSCSNAISQTGEIVDFESCVAAGNKVLRSYPPKCAAPEIGIFTKNIEGDQPDTSKPFRKDTLCKDTCGDGECAQMVCQAEGCPCAESKENCPRDCKE